MTKQDDVPPSTASSTEMKLINALVDREIENAVLAQKHKRLLEQNPYDKTDQSDTHRQKLIYSLNSHNPPHLEKTRKKTSSKARRTDLRDIRPVPKKVLKIVSAYILIFVTVYYLAWLIS